jgi:branched-chain amino acid transport system substrate-binding protein
MAKRNELPALAASLLITLALLGGGGWWLSKKFFGTTGIGPNITQTNRANDAAVAGADGSSGSSILPESASADKQSGLAALAAGDYATAQTEFAAALKANRNDPESLIYLNNAKIGEAQAYTIAVSVPVGSAINPASEMMRGAAQAQTDINEQGGIAGKPLKVLLLDDQDDPAAASAIATELVNDKDVLGVVGHYSSGTTLEAAKVYEAGKLTLISPTSTAVKIADAGDYIFRTVPSDRLAAATLSRYALNQLKKTKAAVFYAGDSTYSQSIKSEFTTELLSNGGEVVSEFDVVQSGFSAGRAVEEAKSAGAEVIMMALTNATLDTANQIISINQQQIPMLGGDSMYDYEVLDVSRQNALGLTVAVPWHILSHEQTPFVRESRQLWGGDISWRTATAYDAVMALAAGLKANPTREGLAAALSSNLNIEGATAPIRFLPTGDRNEPSQLVQVQPGNRSGTGYDYIPVQ